MKASRKRALRAPIGKFTAKTYDRFGRRLQAEANDNKVSAMLALNKAARLTGNTIDWDNVSVTA